MSFIFIFFRTSVPLTISWSHPIIFLDISFQHMSTLVSFYLFGHQQPYLGCHWHLPLLSASTLTLCLWGISFICCSIPKPCGFSLVPISFRDSLTIPLMHQSSFCHLCCGLSIILPTPLHVIDSIFFGQRLWFDHLHLCRLIIGVALLTTLSIPIVLCCIHNSPFIILSLALSRPSVACVVSWAVGPCRRIFIHLFLLSPSLLIVS